MKKCGFLWIILVVMLIMNFLQIINNRKITIQLKHTREELNRSMIFNAQLEHYKNNFDKSLALQTLSFNSEEIITNYSGKKTPLKVALNSKSKYVIFFNEMGCLSCKQNNLIQIASIFKEQKIEDYLVIANFDHNPLFKQQIDEIGFQVENCYNSDISLDIDNLKTEALIFLLSQDYTIKCPFNFDGVTETQFLEYLSKAGELIDKTHRANVLGNAP